MKEAEHITNLEKSPVELFMMDEAMLGWDNQMFFCLCYHY